MWAELAGRRRRRGEGANVGGLELVYLSARVSRRLGMLRWLYHSNACRDCSAVLVSHSETLRGVH